MIFSDSELEEIHNALYNVKVTFDDKFGIMTLSVYGNLDSHFRSYLLREVDANDNGLCKSRDELIINYLTNTSCKNYIRFLPDHIKNKILANSL